MYKILVADDEEAILLLYTEELSEEGYEVLACRKGSVLMDLIETEHPELLVLDICLGPDDGLDLLREIKRKHNGMPVILCSAYECFKNDIRSARADDFVLKGSSLEELKKKIRKILFKASRSNHEPEMRGFSRRLHGYQQESFGW